MKKIKFWYMNFIKYFCRIAMEIIRSFESSSFIRVAIKRHISLKVAVKQLLPFLLFVIPLLCAGRFISTKFNLKTMQQFFKNQIKSVASMTKKERNILLCQLSVKEHLNTIEPHEIIQLATIQAIRQENGEIDAVLKNWEENPEYDPRKYPCT